MNGALEPREGGGYAVEQRVVAAARQLDLEGGGRTDIGLRYMDYDARRVALVAPAGGGRHRLGVGPAGRGRNGKLLGRHVRPELTAHVADFPSVPQHAPRRPAAHQLDYVAAPRG